MINLEWYRIFLHTARTGNFTKAAEQLHITQPSVSYAIKQLEELLGLKLFHRLSKGVELTKEGSSLLSYVEQSFSLLNAGEQYISDLKRLTEGEIRIGASDSLIKHLLLPKLDQYRRENPAIRIRLTHGRTHDIAMRLKSGQVDCAIIHMPLEDEELNVQKLTELDSCFVVGQSYRSYADRSLTASELVELPLLLMSPGSRTRSFVEQWFAAKGISVWPDMELGSVDLLMEFARLGFGAAFLSRSFVEEELNNGRLFELQLNDPLPSRSIGFATRRAMPLSIAADRFASILME